ncbi:MAG: alpha/beta fold hydrolase [Pseudomonadota bacterium]
MKPLISAFKSAAVLLTILAVAAVISFPFIERALMYHPDRRTFTPEEVGADGFEEAWHQRPDGVRVLSWIKPPRTSDAPLYFYLHGNGGHMGGRAGRIVDLTANGAGLVIMTYRGYSGSDGKPSEARNVADAKAVLEASTEKLGVAMDRVVLFGESLGTAIAAQLAVAYPVRGLVLDSPFTSMVAAGRYHFPYLPVRWFLRDRYETDKIISRVQAPILMLHREIDPVVPTGMSAELETLATAPVVRHVVPGTGHVDHDGTGTMDLVARWVAKLPQPSAARKADADGRKSELVGLPAATADQELRPSPAN